MAKKKVVGGYNGRTKRVVEEGKRYSSDGLKIAWCFDRVDRSGKFAFDPFRSDFDHKEMIEKIISYGSMTWADLKRQTHDGGKSKHHFLMLESLSPDAVERVKQLLSEEEFDSVFSLALQNVLRIIGVRRDEKFYVMWYDPKHEFCPSHRK